MKTRRTARARRGLSLVEALISLAICAMLLTATAAAYDASTQAIEMNDQFVQASQGARLSLNQILDQVRQCTSIVVDTHELNITTDTGDIRDYALSGTTLQLTLTPSGGLPATYTLARNVQTLNFNTDGKSVTMLITVADGTNTVTLTGSSVPRRTVTYQ